MNAPQTLKFPPFGDMNAVALILAGLCGLIAAIATVFNPLYGPALVAGFILLWITARRAEIPFSFLVFSFAIPVQKALAGIPLNFADGVIVLWGAAWPFLMIRNKNIRLEIPFIVRAALPFILCAALSLSVAVNPGASAKQVIRLVEWFVVLPVLMTSLKPGLDLWRWLAVLFLAVPSFFALDGIVEALNNGESITRMLGIPAPVPSAALSKIRHTFDVSGRAGSAFGGAQGLAMYLVMMMSVIVSLALAAPSPKLRKFAAAALALCLICLFFTESRGGFMGSAVMMMAILFAWRPRLGAGLAIAGGFAFSALLLWLFLWHGWDGTITGLVPGRPTAVLDRLIIWSRAFSIFSEHPVLGVGFGGFHDAVYQSGGINLNVELGYESLHCHNTYLEVLTGTGILGFLCYLGFLFACFKKIGALWRKRRGGLSDCFILAAIGALAAYMTFGMVDMLFIQNMHFVLIAILTLAMTAGKEQS